MSQADYHSDSSASPVGGDGSSSVPPPPPAPSQPRPKPPAAVPPPPPARSAPSPVRVTATSAPVSGVGSAKGVRWRDEEKKVKPQTKRVHAAPEEEGEDVGESTKLSREAPPWLVSMVFHLVLLVILALISSPAGAGLGQVMLTIGQSTQESPSEFAEFGMATEFTIEDAEAMEDSEAEVDVMTVFDSLEASEAIDLTPVDIGVGAEVAVTKPMFNGRTGAMKSALMAIYGGTAQTQEAVAKGLAWLKRNQKSDGSWSMRGPYSDRATYENKVAATAMALLAFLGDGHTHLKGDYSEQVEKGMQFLIKQQDRQGFFARQAREHQKMYAQAQATIAICELYAMSKDSWLRPRVESALEFARTSQSAEGGWRYDPGYDSDTSVTGWFVMALQSGRSAGLAIDPDTLTRVDEYLDSASSYEGAAYGYQARTEPTASMTAEGILCRQYISWKHDHPAMKRGIDALLTTDMFDINTPDVYYWYYATQVMHHYGGEPWRKWNEVMRVQLPKAQVTGGKEDGSWAPQQDRWGSASGRLYTTCLSIYCLEVYYRHMPLYQGHQN